MVRFGEASSQIRHQRAVAILPLKRDIKRERLVGLECHSWSYHLRRYGGIVSAKIIRKLLVLVGKLQQEDSTQADQLQTTNHQQEVLSMIFIFLPINICCYQFWTSRWCGRSDCKSGQARRNTWDPHHYHCRPRSSSWLRRRGFQREDAGTGSHEEVNEERCPCSEWLWIDWAWWDVSKRQELRCRLLGSHIDKASQSWKGTLYKETVLNNNNLTADGGQSASKTMPSDANLCLRIHPHKLLDFIMRDCWYRVIGIVEPLMHLATYTSCSSRIINELKVHIFDPVEIVISASPRDEDSLTGDVITHESFDLSCCVLYDWCMLEVGIGFAECAVPCFDLGIRAVGDDW